MAKSKKSKDIKKTVKKKMSELDTTLLEKSDAILTLSIMAGHKWNKLVKKGITVSKPMREKQVDMFFDTTEAVRDQIEDGVKMFKDKLGIEEPIVDILKKELDKSTVARSINKNVSKLVSVVVTNDLKKKVEQGAVKIKMEIEKRRPVAKKARKSTKKVSAKKPSTSKKSTIKAKASTTKTKATTTKATTAKSSKIASSKAKKVKATKTAKPTKAAKTTSSKRKSSKPKKVASKSKPTTRTKKASKDDLTLISGIGPKMEGILFKKGIKTYQALKVIPLRDLQKIIDTTGGAFAKNNPKDWRAQAVLASKGDMVGLKALKTKLSK